MRRRRVQLASVEVEAGAVDPEGEPLARRETLQEPRVGLGGLVDDVDDLLRVLDVDERAVVATFLRNLAHDVGPRLPLPAARLRLLVHEGGESLPLQRERLEALHRLHDDAARWSHRIRVASRHLEHRACHQLPAVEEPEVEVV